MKIVKANRERLEQIANAIFRRQRVDQSSKSPEGKSVVFIGGGDMNWRRGLFRVWAALSLAWVVLIGVSAYIDLYRAAHTENVYEFPRADGSAFKVVSPTYYDASKFKEREKGGVAAPPCKGGRTTCEPQDRQWEGSGLALLPGATVDAAGKIVGPYSVYDALELTPLDRTGGGLGREHDVFPG
jgi:hypothetical protein